MAAETFNPVLLRSFAASSPEMAALIAQKDWSQTPVGDPATWSPALRMMVEHLLGNGFGLLLWWGPQFVQFYNDAYRPVLGTKHPNSLGQPASSCWTEIWDVIGPMIEQPFHGGAPSVVEDLSLEVNRYGFPEETHFTVAYSPVFDDTVEGGIGGVVATVHETTQKVIGERRIRLLSDLGARTAEAKTAEEACATAAGVLESDPKDVPHAQFYLRAGDGELRLVATAGAAGPETSRTITVSIPGTQANESAGTIVAGVSPHLALDEDYLRFFDLVAAPVGTAITSARAYEEERKRAEALAEVDRAKNVFFSNISHEFRTPLTLMLGPLSELSKTAGSDTAPLVDAAHRNSLRLLKLVNTLLEFSRLEAGRSDATFAQTDLAALTADLCGVFRSAIESAGLKFTTDISLREPVFVDRGMWEKIVLNLLSNALKFTLAGEIRVVLSQSGADAELCVEDSGTGIPEADLPHIFERFRRVRNAEARSHEGSGIGLALTKDLVNLHGGSIEVQSTPGSGSVFRVRIPLGNSHLNPVAVLREPPPPAATGVVDQYLADVQSTIDRAPAAGVRRPRANALHPRILLADDNVDLREYVSRVLAPHYAVDAVTNGAEAFEKARSHQYDLILSDIMMPKMDGMELLHAVRADEALREVPFIFLSARAGEEAAIEGLQHGADGYVVKPFSAGDLLARIESLLRGVRRRESSVTEEAVGRWFERQGDSTTNEVAFRVFADQLPVMVYQHDALGAVSFANTAWFEMTRLPRDPSSFTVDAWLDVAHADDLPHLLATIEAAIPSRSPYAVECRLKGAGTDESAFRWHLCSAVPQFDHAGNFRGWIGTAIDVHDARRREEAERALREAAVKGEQHFRVLAETIPVLAWTATGSGDIDWYNTSFYEYTGLTPDQARGFGWQSLHHRDEIAQTLDLFAKAVSACVPFERTFRIRGKDGEYRWFLSRAVPVREPDGSVVRWYGSSTNVDAEIRASQQQARVARSFQDAALPAAMPQIPGLTFSVLYEPASSEDRVGGDFYDAFRLLDGRIVVSIGDVAGSGLDAAATMSALRQSIRAAANINPDPELLLKAADGVFGDSRSAPFASVFVAVVDPMTFSMRYASAGHMPALLRNPDGSVCELSGNDLLLGVHLEGETTRHVWPQAVEPGSALVLYTDGLTEAAHDPADGERRLKRAVCAGVVSAQRIRDAVLGVEGSSPDDVAVLTLAFDSPLTQSARGDLLTWQFRSDDASRAHRARSEMSSALRQCGLNGEEVFAAELVFSELTGNVVRHVGGSVDVLLDLTQKYPVLNVIDGGPGFSLNPKLPSEPYAERGRGLYIVTQFAREFTTSPRTLGAGTHARAVLCGINRRLSMIQHPHRRALDNAHI